MAAVRYVVVGGGIAGVSCAEQVMSHFILQLYDKYLTSYHNLTLRLKLF